MTEKGKSLVRTISIGFVLILAHAFLFSNAGILFPDKTQEYKIIIATYIVLMSFIFAFDTRSNARTERSLFTAPFFSRVGIFSFIFAASVALLLLIPLGIVAKGDAFPSIREALSGVGLGVILLHALIIAFDEELIFRGFVTNELRASKTKETIVQWTQAILFAAFHYYAAGGEILLMLTYIPLGIIFLAVRDKFTPRTLTANIGVHFAWNLFILGFIQVAG